MLYTLIFQIILVFLTLVTNISDIQIQLRLRFGMVTSIYTHLRLKNPSHRIRMYKLK